MIRVVAVRDENDMIKFRVFKKYKGKHNEYCYKQIHYNQVVIDDYDWEQDDNPAYESFEYLLVGREAMIDIINGRFFCEDLDMSPELLEFAKKGYYDSYREGVRAKLNQSQDSNENSKS